MNNLKSLLEGRFKKNSQNKMAVLTKKRLEGELSPFLNSFSNTVLSADEEERLKQLLESYNTLQDVSKEDLKDLCSLSAQIKQIHHQAVLLHGERIKKARDLLKRYREGAFSSWLLLTYGNRQTPYNFLMYYELVTLLPESLRAEVEKMPRQAVYTLASRQGSQEKKEEIIRNYRGESKGELLELIRKEFPLMEADRRQSNLAKQALELLTRGSKLLKQCSALSDEELFSLEKLIKKLQIAKTNLSSNIKV